MRRATTLVLDVLALLALSVATSVALTGGGVFDIAGVRVRATTADNPLIAAALILALRCWLSPSSGLFATTHGAPHRVSERLNAVLGTILARGWPVRWAWAGVAGLIVLSLVLRITNARHPGFITGDDVEIHDMTLSMLFGYQGDIWSLRNAFFPLTFVFPAQAVLSGVGVSAAQTLVFVGRLSVVAWATGGIVLLYGIGRRLDSVALGLLAAGFFATSRLHLWFGSTELPRPVAAVALLAAFYVLLQSRTSIAAMSAGALLGVAAALRFGEIVFIAPAALQLALERRYREVVLVVICASVTATAILTTVDAWYWSDPLHSVTSIVQYTLIEGQSSRGFQPWWHYVGRFSEWTTLPVLLASVAAFGTRHWRAALWAWGALLMLSVLPHKEARYMVAIQPFVCLAAAGVVVDALRALTYEGRKTAAAIVAALTVLSVSLELANWRIRRSDEGVAIARAIAAQGTRGVAVEQLWRLGGPLYLREVPTVIELMELHAPGIRHVVVTRPEIEFVVLSRTSATDDITSVLRVEGFEASSDERYDYIVYRRNGVMRKGDLSLP
jgi:hypothetical protein